MFEKLKSNYNTFVQKFLTDDQRKSNNIQIEQGKFQIEDGQSTQGSSVLEQTITNQRGRAVLLGNNEESKTTTEGGAMMDMKDGDEDLVDDDYNMLASGVREDTAEKSITGSIPMLKRNKNALTMSTKPFS
jgi:hypothetical protein